MRDLYETLERVLAAAGFTVHLLEAPGNPELPYLLLGPAGATGLDEPVGGVNNHRDASFRVTAVGALPGVAMDLLELAQAVLSPDGMPTWLDVPGRPTEVVWARHESDAFDQQVTVPGATRHLSWSIDSYRVALGPARAGLGRSVLTDVTPDLVRSTA